MIQFPKSKKWLVAASVLMVSFGCQCQSNGGSNNQGRCAPAQPSKSNCDQNKRSPSTPSCDRGCSSSNQEEKSAAPETVQPAISSVQEVKEPVQASTEIAAPVQAEKSDSETTVSVVEPSAEANVDAKAETVAEPAAEPVAAPFVETQAADVATNRASEVKE